MNKTLMRKILLLTLLSCSLAFEAKAQSHPASLSQCIDSALVHNRSLQNAALEIESAREQRSEAYTRYFPQISANVTAFQTFDKLIKSDALALSELNRGYGATISALQPLYAGGQIHTGNQLTQVQEDVCQLQLQLKEKDIREKVTENYWQICTVKYNLRTIAAAEKQLDAVMQQVDNLVRAGVTTRNATLQVRLRKHELASNRMKLENAEKTLLLLLSQLTGISNLDITVPDEDASIGMPQMCDVASAVNLRNELALAGKAVEAQRLMIRMERGKNLPTLAVGVMGYNMGIGGVSDQVKMMTKTNFTNGLALATISVPISSWWGGSHAIKRQEIKLKEAENTLLDARENLRIDIEAAWNNVQEAYSQIGIARASVEEAEENLRMHTEQYRTGTVTITDLLDAETLNRKSHDQLSSAIASYQIALTKYQLKTE